MLYVGLDLSRKRLDFCLLDELGERVEVGAAPPDADGLRSLTTRVGRLGEPVFAAIESMNGARFVHDQLELAGWRVEIADAVKVKGLAPLACKTDRIDAWVLAELARRDLVPAIWLPDPQIRADRERARFRLHLVRHRTSLNGKPCPVSDLFGVAGRDLLERLALPEPWLGTVAASLQLIDELDQQIGNCERELHRLGAEHRYVPLLVTVPGIGWVLAYTIAAELGGPRQERSPLPALGADRSNHARQPPPALPRPLPTHQTTARQTTRRQGRANRPRPPTRRSHLAHAHPRPTLRPGRRRGPPGRLTALKEMRHRKRRSHPT